MTVIDWLVVALYLALMVAIGLAVARRQEGHSTYFLAGRSMPAWAVCLSVLATALSAATFIGAPQIAFGGDLTYLITNVGGVLGALFVALVLLPPIYRGGSVTIYGYLGARFGRGAETAAGVMFLVGRLLASGARLFMAGIAFALILYGDTSPKDLILAIVLLGCIGTVYTAFGGIRAVIWTDTIQIAVVCFAAGLSIYLLLDAIPLSGGEIVAALRHADGVDKLRLVDTRLTLGKPFTVWGGILAMAVFSASTYGVDHDLAQRTLTARSAWRGGAALVASIVLATPVVAMFMAIGLLLSIYYARPELMGDAAPWDAASDTERIFPQFLLNHMPPGLRGLSMAGLFAAAMSSFDSAINAMAGTAVADVLGPWRAGDDGSEDAEHSRQQRELAASRWAVVVMGALLTGFAVLAVFMYEAGDQTLIDFALGVMAFALAPLLGVFVAARFTRRGNTASVLAALAVGAVAVLLLQPYVLPKWCGVAIAWPWWPVIVSPLSFAICILPHGADAPTARRSPGVR